MPHYYFHLLDESTTTLVRDSAGVSLLDAKQAKREAIGLAQDIIPTPHQSELAIYGKDVMERTSLRLCSM